MSDLEKIKDKTALDNFSVVSQLSESEEDQRRHDGSSSASSISSVETARPSSSQRLNKSSNLPTPLWHDYFSEELYLKTTLPDGRNAVYHVYVSRPKTAEAPLIVCHHGAGSTGLSFALFAKEMQKALPRVGIMSINARGHGSTIQDNSGTPDNDFSIDGLTKDFINMINLIQNHFKMQACPSLVLVGHSLGGAVITNVAHTGIFGSKILGFAVLDVVEGSALEALKTMRSYLSRRPESFSSVENAIDWHFRSRTLRGPNSAKVSVPSLLYANSEGKWIWRTQLADTEPFWNDWFKGMSNKFLGSRGAKLLLLAGTDRLDKELMIGQMQGKFQLQVFPAAGHFIQEDLPDRVAETIAEFIERNDRSTMILPPKVSDLIKQGKKV